MMVRIHRRITTPIIFHIAVTFVLHSRIINSLEFVGFNYLRQQYSDPKDVESKQQQRRRMCHGYDGILQINNRDRAAAAGTAFFIHVANQIKYAERNNLLPWVHFTQHESQVYDTRQHVGVATNSRGKPVYFKTLVGTRLTQLVGEGDMQCLGNRRHHFPGPPDYADSDLRPNVAILDTDGVWEHYFAPISAFRPGIMTEGDIESCESKPFVVLDSDDLVGIHVCAPWSVRSWVYKGVPEALRPIQDDPKSTQKWFEKMRVEGNRIVTNYFTLKPRLRNLVEVANPLRDDESSCLAMHIRHTDKAAGRVKVPLEDFLPYAQIYVKNGGKIIYVATDSMDNVRRIQYEWPAEISRRVRRQKSAHLSEGPKAIFQQIDHHDSNTEALVDIYAMARCSLMIHGYSAMSESAIYVNIDLHRRSVNLEDPNHPDLMEFEKMVKSVLLDV